MPVQTDHLADEIKEIATGLVDLRTDLAGFKGSVETELKYIHAATNSLVKVLTGATIAILAGAVGVIWSSSALNSEVKYQGVRIDKVEQRFDKVDGRLDQLSSEVKQQGIRLDKVDGRLDQLNSEVKQQGVRLENVEQRLEQRFDKVDQQFGQILQRLDQVVPKAK
jgi:predicted  nucleic acid-binding Zn-ribbon protein